MQTADFHRRDLSPEERELLEQMRLRMVERDRRFREEEERILAELGENIRAILADRPCFNFQWFTRWLRRLAKRSSRCQVM